MRFRSLLFLATLLISSSRAAEWQFGSMSIQWLDDYTKTPSDIAETFIGPDGEVVMVSAMGLRDGADGAKAVQGYLAFAESQLPRLSASKGKEIVRLRRENLSGGITLFSTAAAPKKDQQTFYLQFFAISPSGRSALFTVAGRGDPASELKRFRPLFDTISWRTHEKKG